MESARPSMRERLRPLQQPPESAIGHGLASLLHGCLFLGCVAAWTHGWWPLCVILWPAIVWMDHAALSRLHESAHGMLYRSRFWNELTGVVIGVLALTPLSVYRYVHSKHHAHLGREKDPEFWPYNLPEAPRWLRLTYAWLELLAGWIVTPMLYSLRTARAWPTLARARRTRLIAEWCLLVASWTTILVVVVQTGTWSWLVVGHLVPTWLAGSVQTVRKFTEHLGRFGETIYDMTRTVVYTRPLGQAASHSQLHVDHHGTHHRWPRIPWHKLPEATPIVYEENISGRIYPNHWTAICDMVPHLFNPKVGPQWKREKLTVP